MTNQLVPSLLCRAAVLFAACLTFSAVMAQTISQPQINNNTVRGPGGGQSFKATLTGTVTAINVQSAGNNTVTLRMYNAANGSGREGDATPAAYTQIGVSLVSAGVGTWQTITLNTPFPVVAGSSYSFAFEGETVLRSPLTDEYGDGTYITNFTGSLPFDLAFQIFESAAPPTPVPTLSEWALITLAGGLGLAGYAAVRRRQRE